MPQRNLLLERLGAAKEKSRLATLPENPEKLTLAELTSKLFISGDLLEGASSKVYVYYDKGGKKALKVNKIGDEIIALDSTAETTKRNLENELNILKALAAKPEIKPHIVGVEKSFTLTDGRLAVVEEFASGERLKDLIEDNRLEPEELGKIVTELLNLKQKFQKNSFYFIDWNSGNIHIIKSESGYIVKFVDFGTSRLDTAALKDDDGGFRIKVKFMILDLFRTKIKDLLRQQKPEEVIKLKAKLNAMFGENGKISQNRNLDAELEDLANGI